MPKRNTSKEGTEKDRHVLRRWVLEGGWVGGKRGVDGGEDFGGKKRTTQQNGHSKGGAEVDMERNLTELDLQLADQLEE